MSCSRPRLHLSGVSWHAWVSWGRSCLTCMAACYICLFVFSLFFCCTQVNPPTMMDTCDFPAVVTDSRKQINTSKKCSAPQSFWQLLCWHIKFGYINCMSYALPPSILITCALWCDSWALTVPGCAVIEQCHVLLAHDLYLKKICMWHDHANVCDSIYDVVS